MIITTFDISKSKTGWAFTDGSRWESGAWACPIMKPKEEREGALDANYTADVADWFDRRVFALLGDAEPDLVGIEQPMPGNSKKTKTVFDENASWAGKSFKKVEIGGTSMEVTHFLHGLAVVACRICGRLNIPVKYVASQTWRSTTGVGTPPKGLTYPQRRTWLKNEAKRICGLRGIKVTGSDQAEACLLAVHLLAMTDRRYARCPDMFQGAA